MPFHFCEIVRSMFWAQKEIFKISKAFCAKRFETFHEVGQSQYNQFLRKLFQKINKFSEASFAKMRAQFT
jgi:hypothetical protein